MKRDFMKKALKIFGVVVASALMLGVLGRRSPAEPGNVAEPARAAASSVAPQIQTDRNLGKAYYEQGKYTQASEQFQKVVASGHALATDYMDLGMALMQVNKLDQALGALSTASHMAPKSVAIHYNLGILYKRELRYPLAESELKQVIAADPNDPGAWFNLGSVYFAEHKLKEALSAHEHLNAMGFARGQNFYVASLFHTFTILVRLGRRADAEKMLKLHQEVSDKVPSISLQNPALEGGKYGAILVPKTAAIATGSRFSGGVSFEDIRSTLGAAAAGEESSQMAEAPGEIKDSEYSLDFARKRLVPLFGSSVAVGDYDSDGHMDLFVTSPTGQDHLLHNNGDGTFRDVTDQAGLKGEGRSISATFADYDNSGHPSLFVTGLGGVRLYKNNGNGTFTDVTQKSGLKDLHGELDTQALLFDADNDGLLDLVVIGYTNLDSPPRQAEFRFPGDFPGASIHFYRNNGNGTFSDITASTGLGSVRGRFRKVLFADLNDSTYADLVFLRDNAPPLLFLNQGDDKFVNRTREAGLAFGKAVAVDGTIADFDHDGNFDLALWTRAGVEVLRNNGHARFTALRGIPAIKPPSSLWAFRGLAADLNGDSFDDLLVADATGRYHFLANVRGHFHASSINLPLKPAEKLVSLQTVWLGKPGILDLLGTAQGEGLVAWSKTGPVPHWLEINMQGSKSNKPGVGSTLEFKKGNFYDKVLVTGGPVWVYTGNLASLDVVRATWPTQIIENKINFATNQVTGFRESERLASSCPLLYAWNGKRFVFVTDVLGVGPLGELAPDGTRIKPYPRELVRLPNFLHERDGSYEFQMTDELREVDYVDRLRLIAVDHPASEHIYANEIYSSSMPAPKLYAIGKEHLPVSAVDDHGRNVLPLISKADGRYPTDFRRSRILGMAQLHSLTLDLGKLNPAQRVSLWLTGWVFWTDSNGSQAMRSNPGLRMISPYLQVRNRQGRWVTVIPDIGVPSGANRTIRVDLTGKFLSSDHHVRIGTNLCVYWDRIFYTTNDTPVERSAELLPESANLHYRGFSVPTSDTRHLRPDYYEYASLLKQAPWNPMAGDYTRYGNVLPLISKTDDHLVVMATGDEMTVKFNANHLPPLRPGWVRSFFLDASGYAKDGEPNTAYARTVAPMPFRSMPNYPPPGDREPASAEYQSYLREYQTRPGYKLIPPLAPPSH